MNTSNLKVGELSNQVLRFATALAITLSLSSINKGNVFAREGYIELDTATTRQQREPTNIRELTRGSRLGLELKGTEVHMYSIRLTAGQLITVTVEQKGIDIRAAVFGPHDQKIGEVDSPIGPYGPEFIFLIAEVSGLYRLEIRAFDEKSVPGKYEIYVTELRTATEKDRDLVVVERVLADAKEFWAQGTSESLRKALECYDRGLVLLRALEGGWGNSKSLDAIEAQTLYVIGLIHHSMGDPDGAIKYFSQALQLQRSAGDPKVEVLILNGLGNAYLVLGAQPKALEYYTRALLAERVLGDRSMEVDTLHNIGVYYVSLGDQQKALEHFTRALSLKRSVEDKRGEQEILTNLGICYAQAGELEIALDYYNQALAFARAFGDHRVEALTLASIGMIYRTFGDHSKALEYFNQSLALRHDLGDRFGEALSLSHIGATYSSLDRPEEALSYLSRALSLHRAIGDRRNEGITLSEIGATYSSLDKPQEGLSYLSQSLSLLRDIGDRRSAAVTLQLVAKIERDRGRLEEARAQIELALEIIESTHSGFVSQELRTSYLASNYSPYSFYVDLLMQLNKARPESGFAEKALQASERTRARSLLEILSEAQVDIRQGVDSQLLDRERSVQQQLNLKSEALMRLPNKRLNNEKEKETVANKELNSLMSDYQNIEAQIRAESPRYAALTQPEPLTVNEIQREVLDGNTLLLEYSLGEKRSYLWVVSSNSIRSFELPQRSEIEAKARLVYKLFIAKADGLYLEALNDLSRMLLGPVADRLGQKRLVVVAEGALQYIPFGALSVGALRLESSLTSKPYQPLILEHEIVNLPSASVLAVLRKEVAARPSAAEKLVVFADPVFTRDDRRVRLKSQHIARNREREKGEYIMGAPEVERSASDLNIDKFNRLPFTRREANLITAQIPQKNTLKLLNFSASRALAKSAELSRYQIVHFATHSLLNNRHPELSGIVLSLVDEQGQPQDGFLRLHEIYNMKLEADLVVLSACQSALGKEIKGEGIIGLTRGFMYAGSPRVVASLWEVSDAATAELMNRFYENMLAKGMRPAAALRMAQVSLLGEKQWSAPYYWAGFVFQGEWR